MYVSTQPFYQKLCAVLNTLPTRLRLILHGIYDTFFFVSGRVHAKEPGVHDADNAPDREPAPGDYLANLPQATIDEEGYQQGQLSHFQEVF